MTHPVLSAVAISALAQALNPRPLVALGRLGHDEAPASCAVVAVVVLCVAHGKMLAVLLSVVAAVRRFSKSRLAVLGTLCGTREHHVLTRSLGRTSCQPTPRR